MEQNLNTAAEQLRQQLIALRNDLKKQKKKRICGDDSIDEMVRLMPRKASDFYSIPGVGPAFVENYAERFLEVLKGSEAARLVGEPTMVTLRELSKKLINITRNNRMLFLPRLSAKYAVDLFDSTGRYNPLDILFNASSPQIIADVSDLFILF